MHETETDVQQPNRFRQAGLVAAASVIGGLGALAEVAAGEARRRHRGNRNDRDDDRKDERRDDRREERREDRQDDRQDDREQNARASQQEEHPRREAAAAANDDGGDDAGGNNHVPEQTFAAEPFPGFNRVASRSDYTDQIPFVS